MYLSGNLKLWLKKHQPVYNEYNQEYNKLNLTFDELLSKFYKKRILEINEHDVPDASKYTY